MFEINALIILGFGMPGTFEWVIIGVVALLIFGRRLPEVARSMGKGIVEFKRGLRDVHDNIETSATQAPPANPPAAGVAPPISDDNAPRT